MIPGGTRFKSTVPPSAKVPLLLKDPSAQSADWLKKHADLILRLARLESADVLSGEVPEGSVQDVVDEATIILPVAGVVDFAAERERLGKEIAKQDKEIQRFEGKLANEKFVANAPAEVVETEREKLTEARLARDKLTEALERLKAVG